MTEGNYILRETKAPMGYDIHPDMRVSLSHYGVLTVDGVVIMDDKVVLPEARTAYPCLLYTSDMPYLGISLLLAWHYCLWFVPGSTDALGLLSCLLYTSRCV